MVTTKFLTPMIPDYASELTDLTTRMADHLMSLPSDIAARRPAPGKWSIKEIVGHLIDSALNNQGRFVRAMGSDDLVFEGYDQDAWVESQRYRDAPWPEIVVLWRALNLHLARTMETIPLESRMRERRTHNLDQIGFRTVSTDQPTTLDYLMSDYVEHLKHHLRQIESVRGASG